MQRITDLTKIFWFVLKSRHCLFRLWDTSRSIKHYVIALRRLLTVLVQAMLASYNSSVSAKGRCRDTCFCLVGLVTLNTPIQPYFLCQCVWNLKEWLPIALSSSGDAGKILGMPKELFSARPCCVWEGRSATCSTGPSYSAVRRCLQAFPLWMRSG